MANALHTALRNIRRSPYQSLMATLMMSLLFFISYTLVMMLVGAHDILRYFEMRPQVIAFFATDVNDERIQRAADTMKAKPYVAQVKIISKEDALKLYQQDITDPLTLELITSDILPASLEVSANNIDDLSKVRDDLKTLEGIHEVKYQEQVIDTLSIVIKNVRVGGMIFIAFLTAMSVMFVVVVLSLRVALKRQEISIMRLLGAGTGYIVGPYLFEGMVYGSLGAIIGWLGMFTTLLNAYLDSIFQYDLTLPDFTCAIIWTLGLWGDCRNGHWNNLQLRCREAIH
jgi:cell division transport system permease protein